MDSWIALNDWLEEIRLLGGISALLGWDQQTGMPKEAGPERAAQCALVARLSHERFTDPRVGDWLATLEQTPTDDPVRKGAVRNLRRDWDRKTKLPGALVEALARAESEGFEAWVGAKATSDFRAFAPSLRRMVALQREQAAAIDSAAPPYDVLLAAFEPGATTAWLRPLFARLRVGLVELLDGIAGQPGPSALVGPFDRLAQRRVSDSLLTALGYERLAGRLDDSEHPFSTSCGRRDVRVTTHLYDDDLLQGIFSTIHECGHALYELGLPHQLGSDLVARAASMGLHESQSRFWENVIGRSRPFARWLAPQLADAFPTAGIDAERLYGALNRVERGLIRVDADEVTYNLHVLVRFELEAALFDGAIDVDDLPYAWDQAMEATVGARPGRDAEGVLQDVHWSVGAFGYFPSYTLGNLYSASLRRGIEEAIPDLWDQVGRGEFSSVLGWLRTHVHAQGHLVDAPDVVRRAVGERDAVEDLLGHLWERVSGVYGVSRPA